MNNKNAIIWGSGKIGRGFAADVLRDAGYRLSFWDADQDLMQRMQKKGGYTILKLGTEQGNVTTTITDYTAYTVDRLADFEKAVAEADVIAISVFPKVFPEVTKQLAEILEKRSAKTDAPVDIIVLANIPQAGSAFRNALLDNADAQLKAYIDEKVGINEAIVIRMAVVATQEMLDKDDLVVPTNGFPVLYVDGETFKGERPESEGIQFIENCLAWEQRKMYTYNMVHALFAYMGGYRGNQTVCDCMNDDVMNRIASGALEEIGEALQLTFGFGDEEMRLWIQNCKKNMQNPYLNDQLARVGMDPIRKLKSGDRLAGAALLCKRVGVMPYWLTKAIAYGLFYSNENDPASKECRDYVSTYGVRKAAVHFCGFEKEAELVQLICDRYIEAIGNPAEALQEDIPLVKLYRKAWKSGFDSEHDIRACAQGMLYAAKDTMRMFDESVFNAATPFSAGMGMCGDGPCGGYSGGLMLIGLLHSRTLDNFYAKDKVELYRSFELAQRLHDRFVECYGGIRCKDVHLCIYDRAYTLRNPEDKAVFEDVGAHRDKCTTVIGMAQYMLLQIVHDTDPDFLQSILTNGND